MDFFDRHKALIITVLFCSVLLLALFNLSLSQRNQQMSEMMIDLESLEEEEEQVPEEPEPEEEKPRESRQTAQTHRAFNEDQEARDENFDRQLNEILEKNSASQEETTPEDESISSSGNYSTRNSEKETEQKRSDGDNTSTQTSAQTGGIENSSITFSLRGRSAIHIPNPIYTCDVSGKVVVNITVNAEGRVLKTSINGSSTTSNECLTERAMEYASQAVFSSLDGRNSQIGTITYHFKP